MNKKYNENIQGNLVKIKGTTWKNIDEMKINFIFVYIKKVFDLKTLIYFAKEEYIDRRKTLLPLIYETRKILLRGK